MSGLHPALADGPYKWRILNPDSESESDPDDYDKIVERVLDDVRDRPCPTGRVDLVCGPMFSGKSTELLRRIRRYAITHDKIVVFKHKKDVRFSEDMALTTHDVMVQHRASSFQVHAVSKLSGRRATEAAADARVVAVDEGQFFSDVVAMANKWADDGKIVVVAALDTNYKREAWDYLVDLCPDNITKLTSVCSGCGGDATFTRRTTDETELEVVGGEEKYEAVCRACYVAGSK